ncbi:trigger factor, partial [Pseudomonas sp. MWU12-2534b]
EDYHGKDVAGKKAVFEILVKNVAEATLPEVNEEFAKMLGIAEGDVEKMRGEIRKNVEREVKRRLQARIKENVMQALIDATELELPKALVSLEIGRLVEQARREMQQRGMNVKDMPFPPELFAAQAERRVKLGLILSEMVEANKLEAKPEQVRGMITEFAD